MDDDAIERARERLAPPRRAAPSRAPSRRRSNGRARGSRGSPSWRATSRRRCPRRVEEAVREGVRAEALPVARQLAEVRGLAGQMIRRLERLEGDLLAEQHSRVDDLALLVDLITSGWKGVDDRLARLERNLQSSGGAIVYRIEERR